jgi:hypothetical protein
MVYGLRVGFTGCRAVYGCIYRFYKNLRVHKDCDGPQSACKVSVKGSCDQGTITMFGGRMWWGSVVPYKTT